MSKQPNALDNLKAYTVQQLIDQLELVADKSLPVYFFATENLNTKDCQYVNCCSEKETHVAIY